MPCNRHGGGSKRRKKLWGRVEEVCVCVCWHFVDIQKKRQDPVSKHLFRLKSEWAALKRATQSWVKCFSSIPLSGRAPPPTTFSPISCYLLASWLEAGWPRAVCRGWQTCLDPCFHHAAANPSDHGQIQKTGCFDKSPPSPRKAASQKKALQNQKLIKTFK